MRIGISASPLGALATSASLRALAAAAEQVGYAAVWAADGGPQARPGRGGGGGAGTPGSPGSEPGQLDPLTVAATAAAVTSTIRLGVALRVGAPDEPRSRLPAPGRTPLMRSLVSLDVVSDGRLLVSLGAAAAGRRALERTLEAVAWHWGPPAGAPSVVSAPEILGERLAAQPRPPVLVAAPGGWGRDLTARWADGWHASGPPLPELAAGWSDLRRRAALLGRDPDRLRLVVWAPVVLADAHQRADRALYSGSVDQVADDVAATKSAGAHEIVLSLAGPHGLDATLDAYARIAETVGLRGSAG